MARIIEVASLIHKEPRQWTRPRLALRLEVDIATIQRDIDLLRDMGIEIMPRGKQGYETGYKTTMGMGQTHPRRYGDERPQRAWGKSLSAAISGF